MQVGTNSQEEEFLYNFDKARSSSRSFSLWLSQGLYKINIPFVTFYVSPTDVDTGESNILYNKKNVYKILKAGIILSQGLSYF